MLPEFKLFKVLPNEMNKIDVPIVPAGNPGIEADKTHHDVESTSLDAVAADIHTDLDLLKREFKRANAKGLNEFLGLLEK
jgi:peptidyl-tRNA hydrolase